MTTVAAINRLIHYSVIIALNISSYRLDEAKKKQPQSTGAICLMRRPRRALGRFQFDKVTDGRFFIKPVLKNRIPDSAQQ